MIVCVSWPQLSLSVTAAKLVVATVAYVRFYVPLLGILGAISF